MTCAEAEQLLDSFVDAELPGSMLLEVARHAGSCPACDRAVREVTTLRESVERVVRREVEGVDLSGVWPAVERRIGRSGTRGVWRHVHRQLPGARVGIMKDRKYGTTLIMVSAPGEDTGQ